jgi:replicative DNA helicase
MNELPANVPPNNQEAEAALLGAILLDPSIVDQIEGSIGPDDFYKSANSALFAAILNFKPDNPGATLDIITLKNYLQSKDALQKCGGIAYISSLSEQTPATANAQTYVEIIKENSMRRKAIELSDLMRTNAYDGSQDISKTIDELEGKLNRLMNAAAINLYYPIQGLLNDSIRMLEERIQSGKFNGIPTGFEDLDALIGGFKNSEYSIIGARPSVGKTALAISIMRKMAFRENGKVNIGFFSLEMDKDSIVNRMIAAESDVGLRKIMDGTVSSQEKDQIINVVSENMYTSNFYIVDTPNMKLRELRSQARKLVRENGVQIIFIDYIGLIDPDMDSRIPRYEQMSQVSRSLKQLCRELKVPVCALSQVGRQVAKDHKEPDLADLRETGAIEQDADMVILLHRPEKQANKASEETIEEAKKKHEVEEDIDDYKVSEADQKRGIQKIKVIVAKNRNGATGHFFMNFVGRTARFDTCEQPIKSSNI